MDENAQSSPETDQPVPSEEDPRTDPLSYRDRFKTEERDQQAEHDSREAERAAQREEHNRRVASRGSGDL